MIKQFLIKYLKTFVFWMLFFSIHRLIFVLYNQNFAADTSFFTILKAFVIGLRLDMSFTGYLMMLQIVVQLVMMLVKQRICLRCFDYVVYPLIVILSASLLGDTNLYSYWGKHMDLEALEFLKTPDIVMASLQWYQMLAFIVVIGLSSWGFMWAYRKVMTSRILLIDQAPNIKVWSQQMGTVLFSGALLILPVRGSLGVAPINTGVAYFSSSQFANHTAINPLWNVAYSLKRNDVRKIKYHFMDDEAANSMYAQMTMPSGEYTKLLKTDRPNVVVILLESHSSEIMEALGGKAITPNLNKLAKEGVLFSNIYAASTRSDKGIVATVAGYQVLPAYSIIRFPEMTSSLPFLPTKMKENGYKDLAYMYGGDIKFKNMNSFVTQAGFEQVISIDDFPSEYRGKKWGVHDQYTFERLADEMAAAKEPYFKFFFTLSSHEPFDVPMERVYEDDYHNSIHYTDKCLGAFFETVKKKGLWDNTLFVMIADHGVKGSENRTPDTKEYHHIPMVWAGGALAVKDTVINKIGSQTDLAATLLGQLNIDASDFHFSKNILDEGIPSYAFFTHSGTFGLIEPEKYQVYNTKIKRFIHANDIVTKADSIKGKAYLQVLYNDHKSR